MSNSKDRLTLKWGTLKSWNFESPEAKELFEKWCNLGVSISCACQENTDEQKKIICQLIDLMPDKKIYLEWNDEFVSKKKAKEYVMSYE